MPTSFSIPAIVLPRMSNGTRTSVAATLRDFSSARLVLRLQATALISSHLWVRCHTPRRCLRRFWLTLPRNRRVLPPCWEAPLGPAFLPYRQTACAQSLLGLSNIVHHELRGTLHPRRAAQNSLNIDFGIGENFRQRRQSSRLIFERNRQLFNPGHRDTSALS